MLFAAAGKKQKKKPVRKAFSERAVSGNAVPLGNGKTPSGFRRLLRFLLFLRGGGRSFSGRRLGCIHEFNEAERSGIADAGRRTDDPRVSAGPGGETDGKIIKKFFDEKMLIYATAYVPGIMVLKAGAYTQPFIHKLVSVFGKPTEAGVKSLETDEGIIKEQEHE